MAWIVKPSGTMEIERREEPYLTDEMKAELEKEILSRYPSRQAATLPLLHHVQHEYNWIPYQAIEEIADFLEITAAQVHDTATFYEEFFLQPKGKHLIQICQSLSCELCGHQPIWDNLCKKLDIVEGETTDDGKFTLLTVECLGSCGTAPAILIDGHLHEKVTWQQVEKLIDDLARS